MTRARAQAGSAPVALVSRSALAANARLLPVEGGVADLRHDAWGHGVATVSRTLFDAGLSAAIVDAGVRDALAAVSGVDASRLVVRGGPTLDPARLFGLPGSGGTPVLRLTGSVLSAKPLLAGEGVSYGYLHRAASDTRVALVSGGYAQGIVRSLGGRISVLVRGAVRPVVGRIAMDACVVDIDGVPVERGDEVVFFGDPGEGHPSLTAWVDASGMSAAELITAVGLRARREEVA